MTICVRVSATHDAAQGRQDARVLAFVRSVRRGRKVVQETVAQLGELDARGAQGRSLAQAYRARGGSGELYEPARPAARSR